MSLTFAFITDGRNDHYLESAIKSVQDLPLKGFQILVIGNSKIENDEVQFVPFDEDQKPGWITRKKNLAAELATHDVVVILHDYFVVTSQWSAEEVEKLLQSDWDVAIIPVLNLDGSRFRDWVLWPFSHRILRWPFVYTLGNLLPYHIKDLTDFMYVNGSAMVVKRTFFLENPLDETRCWGQGEDVEWSIRLRTSWNLKLFESLSIRAIKEKVTAFRTIDPFSLIFIRCYAVIFRSMSERCRNFLQIPY